MGSHALEYLKGKMNEGKQAIMTMKNSCLFVFAYARTCGILVTWSRNDGTEQEETCVLTMTV